MGAANSQDGAVPSGIDLWALAGLPGALPIATYLSTTAASQYRLIVDVLLDQQQHSLTGVPRDQLAEL